MRTRTSLSGRPVTRRDALRLLAGGYGALIGSGAARAIDAAADAAPAKKLREKFAKDFAVGVGLDGSVPGDYSPAALAIVRDHFAILTPANCMKMAAVQRDEGVFDFAEADAFVAFAKANKLPVVGHTLLWARDDATPAWVFKDGDGPATRELVLKRMRQHIEALADRYKGRVAQWDVVNEALADEEGGYLRPSKWLDLGGPDFIAQAFEYAHAAAPDA